MIFLGLESTSKRSLLKNRNCCILTKLLINFLIGVRTPTQYLDSFESIAQQVAIDERPWVVCSFDRQIHLMAIKVTEIRLTKYLAYGGWTRCTCTIWKSKNKKNINLDHFEVAIAATEKHAFLAGSRTVKLALMISVVSFLLCAVCTYRISLCKYLLLITSPCFNVMILFFFFGLPNHKINAILFAVLFI